MYRDVIFEPPLASGGKLRSLARLDMDQISGSVTCLKVGIQNSQFDYDPEAEVWRTGIGKEKNWLSL